MEVLEVLLCPQGLPLRLDTKVTTSRPLPQEATAGVTKVANMIMEAKSQEDTELDRSLMALDPNTSRSA